jgi:L-ribulose-5-phosphate 4-epimerase
VTRFLTKEEVDSDYELNTGKLIIERFENLESVSTPAVLVAGHGPFTWGKDAADSVNNNIVLERTAAMAMGTLQLNKDASAIPDYIRDKHYNRKHGPDAYYGQK